MKTTSIRFYYNGLRINGEKKLVRVFYSVDNDAEGREEVSISARDYDSLPGDVFAVSNNTDCYTDYFENDSAVVTPAHPLYKYVRAAALKSEIRNLEKYLPWAERCAEQYKKEEWRANLYANEAKERREKLEKYRAELETLPKGQPTAADLEAVEAMNNAVESERIAKKHAEELAAREKEIAERINGRKFIEETAEAHPQNSGEPVIRVDWSECGAFYSWEDGELELSPAAAEIIFKHFDELKAAENGGYWKTSFHVIYDVAGEECTYEGRYDLGDNDGGLIAHIRYFADWARKQGDELKAAKIEHVAELLEMSAYADKVRHEIEDEARAAELTVEEYAARGYNVPEDLGADSKPAEIVNVTFAPWVLDAIERQKQEVQDIMDAAEMLPDDALAEAVMRADPKSEDGRHVGGFFLRILYRRDREKALEVLRAWMGGAA